MNENPNSPHDNWQIPWQPSESDPAPDSMSPAWDHTELPTAPFFPSGRREFTFGLTILLLGWLLCNSIFYAGLNLGFAIFLGLSILCAAGYLLSRGCKLTLYSGILLGLSLVIAASFARSDDGFVKFIMCCFLILSVNLGLCLLGGQNRRATGGILSLLDVPRTVFMLGIGKIAESLRGLVYGLRNSGSAGKKGGAVLLGVLVSIPLLAVLIPLLIRADAAFDALIHQLPDWDFSEIAISILFGSLLAGFFYSRSTALYHAPKTAPDTRTHKGLHPMTVNTVLVAVSIVYLVYLISQLAYFSGGFSGILPEGFTMAEYARRGFFEMAWLCAVNMGIIALAVGLVGKGAGKAPRLTRLICLFIGIVTLFLVATASAKMFLYIGSFGLTRLRVLTQVIIIWLGISTLILCLWLFLPKLPYMKVILVLALIIGAAVAWTDVDTLVASYNVNAYQSGKLESVDIDHLKSLGCGAVPYLAELAQDEDPTVAHHAKTALTLYDYVYEPSEDFRDWNYANYRASFFYPVS